MSNLLIRLQSELNSASEPSLRAELAARIAGQLARLGRFEEARSTVQQLRQQFADGHSGRVTVWIMVAEGLIHFYEDLSPLALDRFMRAQLLGIALKYQSVVSFASAWKAHIEFEYSRYPEMIGSIEIALRQADQDDRDSRARVAMILCNSFLVSGDRLCAQAWFMKARGYALANGDQASIEALLYNRAVFAISLLRSENCFDELQSDELARAKTELLSSKNLQAITRNSALSNHIQLWMARLLMLHGQFEQAKAALLAARNQSPFANHNFSRKFLDLEVSYCLFNLGSSVDAIAIYRSLTPLEFDKLDIEEQLAASWMICELSKCDHSFGDADECTLRLDKLKSDYKSYKAALRARLEPFANA